LESSARMSEVQTLRTASVILAIEGTVGLLATLGLAMLSTDGAPAG
jgi:hypothetical protein